MAKQTKPAFSPRFVPTPEQIAEGCEEIRDAGFVDTRGRVHEPWDETVEWNRGGCHGRPHVELTDEDGWLGNSVAYADTEHADRRRKRARKREEDD